MSYSLFLLVKSINLLSDIRKSHASLAMVLADGLRLIAKGVHLILLVLFCLGGTDGTSEDILVLLLGEVDIVVSMRVGELGWVIPVILIEGVRAESISVAPILNLEVRDRTATVVIRNLHSASVSLVVNSLSSCVPLLLLTESLEDMVGADLHDAQLLWLAHLIAFAVRGSAGTELANLSVATAGDKGWHQRHVLRVLHVGLAETTLAGTEGPGFAIGHPVIVRLVVLVMLIERVIEITVQPVKLRDGTKIERHLHVLIGLVVVTRPDGVHLLVEVGMDHSVTPIVMGLLCVVLGENGRVEVDR